MFWLCLLWRCVVGRIFVLFVLILGIVGCGVGGAKIHKSNSIVTKQFIRIEGLRYKTSSGMQGKTDSLGNVKYKRGDAISFYIGSLFLGKIQPKNRYITCLDFSEPLKIAQLLVSLDADQCYDNGIQINQKTVDFFTNNNPVKKEKSLRATQAQVSASFFDDESVMTQKIFADLNAQTGQTLTPVEKDDAYNYVQLQKIAQNISTSDSQLQKIWNILLDDRYYGGDNRYLIGATSRLSKYFYDRHISSLITSQQNIIYSKIENIDNFDKDKEIALKFKSFYGDISELIDARKKLDWKRAGVIGAKNGADFIFEITGLDKEYPAVTGGVKAAIGCATGIFTGDKGKACIEEAVKTAFMYYEAASVAMLRKDYNSYALAQAYLKEYYNCGMSNQCLAKKYDVIYPNTYVIMDAVFEKENMGVLDSSLLDPLNFTMRNEAVKLVEFYQTLVDDEVDFVSRLLGISYLDGFFQTDYEIAEDEIYKKALKIDFYGISVDRATGGNLELNYKIFNKFPELFFTNIRAYILDEYNSKVYIPIKVKFQDNIYDIKDDLVYTILHHHETISGKFLLHLDEDAKRIFYQSEDANGNVRPGKIFFDFDYSLSSSPNKKYTQMKSIYFDTLKNLDEINRLWNNQDLVIDVDKQDIDVFEGEEVCINTSVDLGNYHQADLINKLQINAKQIYGKKAVSIRPSNIRNQHFTHFTKVSQQYCFQAPEVENGKLKSVYKFRFGTSYNGYKGVDSKIVKVNVKNSSASLDQFPSFDLKRVFDSSTDSIDFLVYARDDKNLDYILWKVYELDNKDAKLIDRQYYYINYTSTDITKKFNIDTTKVIYHPGKQYKIMFWVGDSAGNVSLPKTIYFNLQDNSSQQDRPEVVKNVIYGEVAANGTPLSGITVKFEYIKDGMNVSETDVTMPDGSYKIELSKEDFDNFKDDTKLVISAYADGYVPQIKEITKTDETNINVDFQLEPIKENEIVLEIEPHLHHLGDGKYRGSVNSDFQRAGAEGTEFEKKFDIDANQFNYYQKAEITFEAKGVQYVSDKLYINNHAYSLQSSPDDGSYATQKFTIDKSQYHEGENSIKITSGYSTDYDDFEFINIKITFTEPDESNMIDQLVNAPGVEKLEADISDPYKMILKTTFYSGLSMTPIDKIYWKITSPTGKVHEDLYDPQEQYTEGSATYNLQYGQSDVFDTDGTYKIESYVIDTEGRKSSTKIINQYIDIP